MDRFGDIGDDVLRRTAMNYFLGWSGEQSTSIKNVQPQHIPINVYETSDDVVIVAPMPGVEAENIDIEVTGSSIVLRAGLRGHGQLDRDYLVQEWTYGPYERRVELPIQVDPSHANASHDNGVLVVSLPKTSNARAFRVQLRQSGTDRSVYQGHSGHHSAQGGLQE